MDSRATVGNYDTKINKVYTIFSFMQFSFMISFRVEGALQKVKVCHNLLIWPSTCTVVYVT